MQTNLSNCKTIQTGSVFIAVTVAQFQTQNVRLN